MNKEKIIDEGKALIEMYKAGFLDGFSKFKKLKSDKDYLELNKFYKLSFNKRFGRKITKELKKMKGGVKKGG
jgi:hypothetical protein